MFSRNIPFFFFKRYTVNDCKMFCFFYCWRQDIDYFWQLCKFPGIYSIMFIFSIRPQVPCIEFLEKQHGCRASWRIDLAGWAPRSSLETGHYWPHVDAFLMFSTLRLPCVCVYICVSDVFGPLTDDLLVIGDQFLRELFRRKSFASEGCQLPHDSCNKCDV